MAKKQWSELTSGQRTAAIVAGCVQLSLAYFARGRKMVAQAPADA